MSEFRKVQRLDVPGTSKGNTVGEQVTAAVGLSRDGGGGLGIRAAPATKQQDSRAVAPVVLGALRQTSSLEFQRTTTTGITSTHTHNKRERNKASTNEIWEDGFTSPKSKAAHATRTERGESQRAHNQCLSQVGHVKCKQSNAGKLSQLQSRHLQGSTCFKLK